MLHEIPQQVALHLRQPERSALGPHLHRAEVEHPPGEGVGVGGGVFGRGRVALVPAAAAEQAVDAREEDGQLERLGEVIVGAGLEPAQHVVGAAAGGEHQDRHVLPGGPQLRGRLETVLAGQHDVEDDDVERLVAFEQQGQRLLAVVGHGDVMAFGLEVEAQAVGDVRLVVHDEDAAHAGFDRSTTVSASPANRGSSTVNVAPWPSPSLCANTRPPWARAIERTI